MVAPAVVVGAALIEDRDRAGLHAMYGASLTALNPEVALAFRMPGQALEVLFEAALCLGSAEYTSKVDPTRLKAERKRLEKALPASARNALRAAVDRYLGEAKPGDFSRYLDGASKTPARAAMLLAGDLDAVRARVLHKGAASEPLWRDLLEFVFGGDLQALTD